MLDNGAKTCYPVDALKNRVFQKGEYTMDERLSSAREDLSLIRAMLAQTMTGLRELAGFFSAYGWIWLGKRCFQHKSSPVIQHHAGQLPRVMGGFDHQRVKARAAIPRRLMPGNDNGVV